MPPIPQQIVLSVSRRTDIPAFYLSWFMQGLRKGVFEVPNPYNQRVSRIAASPERVHSMVFWSKNFGPFIDSQCGRRVRNSGYGLLFNFTINSPQPLLEPGVPPLDERLKQLAALAADFGPRSIQWRFDPICFFEPAGGRMEDNLGDFERIARAAADCGVERCITSFRDDYRKIDRRVDQLNGFRFCDPPTERKVEIIMKMAAVLEESGLSLKLCCEPSILEQLPDATHVGPGGCVPCDLLMELYGGRLSLARDRGQRGGAGCSCHRSVDIGSYRLHPCHHRCLYCYANPSVPPAGWSGPLRGSGSGRRGRSPEGQRANGVDPCRSG